jgi:hypothetical protein
MISFKEYLEEAKRGLWDNIHDKQERIKNGSGEKMRKPGSKGAPTAAALKASQNEEVQSPQQKMDFEKMMKGAMSRDAYNAKHKKPLKPAHKVIYGKNVKEEVEAQFDLIEDVVEEIAVINGIDSELVWEWLEVYPDDELLEYAIDAKGYKSSTGGLTQKGVNHYRSVTPGSHLQTAVTTKPSKLKPGSKAANRRKSFCARMSGVEGPMKKPNGEPTRKALALRKWNC